MAYTSEFPPFYVTVDIVVFTIRADQLCALAVQRGSEPYQGRWALPGGFVDIDEDLVAAAARELVKERFLLQEDADRYIKAAKASDVLR